MYVISHRSGPFNYLCLQEPYSVPLGIAAQEGHTETVERLLDAGAIVNCQDKVVTNTVLCVYCPVIV